MGLPISFLESILHPQQDEEIDIVAEMEKEKDIESTRPSSKIRKNTNKTNTNSGTATKRTKTAKGSSKGIRQNKEGNE